jgi:hypothetical protein
MTWLTGIEDAHLARGSVPPGLETSVFVARAHTPHTRAEETRRPSSNPATRRYRTPARPMDTRHASPDFGQIGRPPPAAGLSCPPGTSFSCLPRCELLCSALRCDEVTAREVRYIAETSARADPSVHHPGSGGIFRGGERQVFPPCFRFNMRRKGACLLAFLEGGRVRCRMDE